MKTRQKNFAYTLLTVVVLLLLAPAPARALNIGSVYYTSDAQFNNDIKKYVTTGTVAYTNRQLVLNGATIDLTKNNSEGIGIDLKNVDEVFLVGKNIIKGSERGSKQIQVLNDIAFNGGGELNVYDMNFTVTDNCTMTISNSTISIIDPRYYDHMNPGIDGHGVDKSNLIIDNSTLQINYSESVDYATPYILYLINVQLVNCHVATPTDCSLALGSHGLSVVNADGSVKCKTFVIKPGKNPKGRRIEFGDAIYTSSGLSTYRFNHVISKYVEKGSVELDAEKWTLTFDNAELDLRKCPEGKDVIDSKGGLKVILKGENVIWGKNGSSLKFQGGKNASISGSGSLKSYYKYMMYGQGTELTVAGGCKLEFVDPHDVLGSAIGGFFTRSEDKLHVNNSSVIVQTTTGAKASIGVPYTTTGCYIPEPTNDQCSILAYNDPSITIGDVAVTAENMNDVLGDGGSVRYDGVGKLTLTNANITGSDYALRTRVRKPLEIEVVGKCALKSTKTGSSTGPNTMSLATNTTFTGTGQLTTNYGINVMASALTVNGPYIHCANDLQGCQGGEALAVENGKLYARIIQGFKTFTLSDGIGITEPKGGYYNGHYVVKTDGTQAYGIMIAPGTQYVEPTGVSLSETSLTLTAIGEATTLEATVSPSNATNKKVTWTSSNPSVATVKDGTVTAKGEGTATITATNLNGQTATCEVTVNTTVTAQELTLNKQELTLKIYDGGYYESEKLVPVFNPTNVTDKTVTWSSGDESVVTVNEDGKVEIVGRGDATVTCTAANGLTATCEVHVRDSWEVNDYLPAATLEGEPLNCSIIDRTNKYCEIPGSYSGYDEWSANTNDPAISIDYEGPVTIPAEVEDNGVTFQVTRIGNYAFKDCQWVTSFTLPEGLQTIGYEAFSGCSAATTIYLPSTLLSADDYAFLGCPMVEDVYLLATTPPDFGEYGFNFGRMRDVDNNYIFVTHVLHVPAASLKLYKQQEWASDFDKIVPIDPVEGDIDGDGEVTLADAEAITDYLLDLGHIDIEAADVDGDGEITIADVTAIIQSIIEE